MPPPSSDWFERSLGAVPLDQYAIDLRHADGSAPVRRWLRRPMRTRGLRDRSPDSTIRGDALADSIDVIVHCQQVTAATPR